MKIYLGYVAGSGATYLRKHSWDCGWYWGFGYIGNRHCHWHFQSLLDEKTQVNEVFQSTWLTQEQWWILRDLFIQAYALRKAADSYRHGGHQTSAAAPYRRTNAQRAKWLNADLKTLLDTIWELLGEWKQKHEAIT